MADFVSLGDCADLVMGQSPPSSSYNSSGKGLPFFQGKTDFGERYPRARVWCDRPAKIAEAGDILISVRAPVGPTNVAEVRSCLGRGIAAIRPKAEMDASYLLFFLRHYEPRLAEAGKGSTFEAISRSDLEEIPVPQRLFSEQQAIAQRLERADRLRRLRQHALTTGDQYLQNVFLDMFGDTTANKNNWDKMAVEDVADVQGGLQVTKRRDALDLKAPYLRVANSFRYDLDLSEVKWMGVTEAELRRTMLQPNDILCVEGHGNIDEVGRASFWKGELSLCTHQNHLIRVRARSSDISALYLCFFLNSTEGRTYFRHTSNTTSGLHTISTSTVRDCPVLLPPHPMQDKFADIVQKHERLRRMQVEALRQAEQLYETLLEETFGGAK